MCCIATFMGRCLSREGVDDCEELWIAVFVSVCWIQLLPW